MKFLSQANIKGKIVLLRSDLNSEIKKRKVILGERIKESVKTVKFLKAKKAKIVIIAHQGQQGKNDFISLKQHAELLNKYTKIKFIKDVCGKKAKNAISKLKSGEAILLENLRFNKNEANPSANNNLLALTKLADIYINDAFSVCHRNHTSIVLFPKYLPSYAGLLLEKEIKSLNNIKLENTLFILGGAKPKDYSSLFTCKNIIACGLFGQSILVAKGKNLGVQNEYLEKEADLDSELKEQLRKIEAKTPIDFAVKVNGKRKELWIEEFPSRHEIFDIGQKSINLFVSEIKKAKSIFMKGPAGDFSSKGFEKGTFEILKAIAKSRAFSVLGGGHLNNAIDKAKINKSKFNHMSLSGGALIKYISGEKLPGIEALG
ncbi:MAG: phosphoglycerate kinase [Nanoarchaeota archaeon]